MEINESGMIFGPYEECKCCHIEKSQIYNRIQDGIKICEFLLLKEKQKILIVEAKSSSPHPSTRPNFEDFINEIYEKMLNTFSLYMACRLKRHGNHLFRLLPQKLNITNIKKLHVKFILVIPKHKEEWCSALQDALHKKLHKTIKTWRLDANSVAVINEAIARAHKLIQ